MSNLAPDSTLLAAQSILHQASRSRFASVGDVELTLNAALHAYQAASALHSQEIELEPVSRLGYGMPIADPVISGEVIGMGEDTLDGSATVASGDLLGRSPNGALVAAESNDTLGTAIATGLTSTSSPYQIDGVIGDNTAIAAGLDVDFYAVNFTVGDRLTIDIDAYEFGGALDSGIRVFDASGTEVAFSDDHPAPGESFSFDPYVEFTAAISGTYYVGISGYANYAYDPDVPGSGSVGSTGNYDLEMTLSPATFETPNDTLTTATHTHLGAGNSSYQISGTIGDNPLFLSESGLDVDMYSFYLHAGDRVTMDIDAMIQGGSFDSELRLFDAYGNELAFSEDNQAPGEPFSYDSYLDFTATESGRYYLGVSGYWNSRYNPNVAGSGINGSTGDYDLEIHLTSYASEANDLITQAIATGLSSAHPGSAQFSGVIGDSPNLLPSNDVDFFALQLNAGDRLTVDVDAFASGTWLDSGLRLFDALGTEVAFSDDDPAPGESFSYDPYLEFIAPTSGNYFLGISGYGNLGYNPFNPSATSTPGSTGIYAIDIAVESNLSEVSNDTLLQAIATGLSPSHPGTVEQTGAIGDNPILSPGLDVDIFSFSMAAGDTITLDIDANALGSSLDAGLRLFDAYGTEIAFSDDTPAPGEAFSLDPYLSFTALDAGNYYIAVSGFANFNYNPWVAGSGIPSFTTGTYTLEMTLTPPEEDVDPNFNSIWGYGLVDAAAAVAVATGSDPFTPVADLGGVNWGLDRVNAPEVWNQGYTGEGIIVAVLDTGVDYTHSDLDANIWVNSGEIAGDGIDNDGNGYVDDVRGWDMVSEDNDPMDGDGHGTHVSGTIAAENNGLGVTGVAYNAQIMPVRVIGDWIEQDEYEYLVDLAQGIYYAVDNGADVINMSLGYDPSWYGGTLPAEAQSVLDAIEYASLNGTVVVMAAGNEYASQPGYPALYAQDWGMAIGAVDTNNQMADFTNYAGGTPLDYVVAPGVDVYSTVPGNGYEYYSGTSMATPHVVGVAALVMEANSNLTAPEVENLLITTANPTGITV